MLDFAIGDRAFENSAGVSTGALEIYLLHGASWANYGSGWPGKNGVPSFVARTEPVVGGLVDPVSRCT